MRKTVLLLFTMAFAVLLMCGVAVAAPGDLDPSFDGDGKVVTDFGTSGDPQNDEASDVSVQPDGKVVVAGYAQGSGQTGGYDEFALARYNADGSLDTLFDSDGKVTTDVIAGTSDRIAAMELQPDGKIVVGGRSSTERTGEQHLTVARYDASGSLDASFDGDGMASVNFGCCSAELNALAIQPDGKIVTAGRMNEGFLLTRYNTDGTLDTSFDRGGKAVTLFGDPAVTYEDTAMAGAYSVAIQTDGKIVAAGSARNGMHEDFALARYNPDGSLDTSFDEDGKLVAYMTSADDYAQGLSIQPDGRLVAGGRSGLNGTGLARFNPDGSFDSSFGTGGKVTTGTGGYSTDIVLQPNGKFLIAGLVYGPDTSFLARYNPDGSPDTSLKTSEASSVGYSPSLALQSDGKPIVAGFIENENNGYYKDFALTRYIGGENDTLPSDTTPPKVVSTTPTNNATGVLRSTNLTATFSEAVDPSTVVTDSTNNTSTTFTLVKNGSTTRISAKVALSSDGKTATLNPYGSSTTNLARCTWYKATVSTSVKDKAGNALDQDIYTTGNQQKVWYFKTRGC
jgi:uncharacterized delta-60 repeat protein